MNTHPPDLTDESPERDPDSTTEDAPPGSHQTDEPILHPTEPLEEQQLERDPASD